MVTHPITNRAQRTVTSLIHPTQLTLGQTVTKSQYINQSLHSMVFNLGYRQPRGVRDTGLGDARRRSKNNLFHLPLIIQCSTVFRLFQLFNHNQLQPQIQTVIQLSTHSTQSTKYLTVANNLHMLLEKSSFFLIMHKGRGINFIIIIASCYHLSNKD